MKILVTCPHPLNRELAGTNIRAVEIARQLARHFTVDLAAPFSSDLQIQGVNILPINKHLLNIGIHQYDVVVTNGTTLPARTYASSHPRPLWVFDLYNPFLLEVLSGGQAHARSTWPRVSHIPHLTQFLLRRADLVLCASPQQEALWTGAMYAAGALTPADSERQDRICIVPFGLPDQPLAPAGKVLKGVHDQISVNDKVLLWGGGRLELARPADVDSCNGSRQQDSPRRQTALHGHLQTRESLLR